MPKGSFVKGTVCKADLGIDYIPKRFSAMPKGSFVQRELSARQTEGLVIFPKDSVQCPKAPL